MLAADLDAKDIADLKRLLSKLDGLQEPEHDDAQNLAEHHAESQQVGLDGSSSTTMR